MDTAQNTGTNICLLPATHRRWAAVLNEREMLYLYAMSGFGKTTQVLAFARSRYREWLRLSASDENFSAHIDTFLQDHGKPRVKTLLILDDLQWVKDERDRQHLFEQLLQLQRVSGLHLMLVSRAALPAYLRPLQVTRQLETEGPEAFRFDALRIRELMSTYPVLAALPAIRQEKLVQVCIEVSLGHPLSINAFCQRASQTPDDLPTVTALATQDIYDFITVHLFGEWTQLRQEAAVHLSVFAQFDRAMAARLLGHQSDAILEDFLAVGSFLTFKAPDTYVFVPFFYRFLQTQLLRQPRESWLPLYETAAACYEQRRDYAEALRCWRQAERNDKIAELVIHLSENAEGCSFARIAQEAFEQLPTNWEQRDPRILGARVLLAAYRMQPEECLAQLERLHQMAEDERKYVIRSGAMAVYVRTVISCPCNTANQLKSCLLHYADDAHRNGYALKNIMPTGNMPSLINGGLDLLPWEKEKKILYPLIKAASEQVMGREAVGIADASMGEILYEQNQRTQAMAYLTKALSAANFGGSIRVQYAATAIMARLFQAEGQGETARDILRNIEQKATQENYLELLPNLRSSLVQSALLLRDTLFCEDWLRTEAPDEYAPFYITIRFQLLTKARVYTALGKTMEALYILDLLENFSVLYQRTYFHIEVLLLKAILLFRREEQWQEPLTEAVRLAQPYGLLRVFADQGAALLPLWKQLDWSAYPELLHTSVILREIKRMAALYPNYLKAPRLRGDLSAKELEVLGLMADGCSNSQIAALLKVNLGTVKFHVANIMKKLEAENRTVAVKIAQEESLL